MFLLIVVILYFISYFKKIGKRIKAVLLTHGHYDHIYGLRNLIKYFPSVMIYTNSYGHEELADSKQNLSYYHESSFIIEGYSPIYINGGDILHFDGIGNIEVISCPGHDPSCLSYKVENNVLQEMHIFLVLMFLQSFLRAIIN